MTRLAAGDLEAEVAGGDLLTVTSLRHRGDELLVAPEALPPAGRVHGRRAGITLLHPWANRLSADEYEAAGVRARVPSSGDGISRDAGGLAIHGLALDGTWAWEAAGASSATAHATFGEHPAFPFPHELTVRAELAPGRLTIACELRPTGERAVPVAFGWHPYFRLPGVARADWVLELPARRRLVLDARGIPTGDTEDEPAEAQPLAARTFDDGYEGLPDRPVLGLSGGGRRLRVAHEEGYPTAQVYAPDTADVVSLEPMTAVTDALRSGRGLRTVAPGGVARAVYAVEVA